MKLLLLLLNLIIVNYVSAQVKLNAITSPQYGVISMLTIDGANFVNSLTSIKINNVTCPNQKYVSTTQLTCGTFSEKFVPANSTNPFQVSIVMGGATTSANIFRYQSPVISLSGITNNSTFSFTGNNLVTPSYYSLKVTDSATNVLTLSPTADSSTSQINFALPNTITGGNCQFDVSDSLGFYYPSLGMIEVPPVISSISSTVWKPSSQQITIVGLFFGTSVTVKIGDNYTVSDVAVTSGSTLTVATPNGFVSNPTISITTSKQDIAELTTAFTYVMPTITVNQVNESLSIDTTNMGTDKSFISVMVNGETADFNYTVSTITVNLPIAINVGPTDIKVTANGQTVSSSFLVSPILTSASTSPSNGGFVTVYGSFLNDCYFQLYYSNGTLLKDLVDNKGNNLCTLTKVGDSAVCPTPSMDANSTFSIMAIRYVDNSNQASSDKKFTTIDTTVFESPTSTPSETPSPTSSQNQTSTPSQTPIPSSSHNSNVESDEPSNSIKLFGSIYLILLLSILLLI